MMRNEIHTKLTDVIGQFCNNVSVWSDEISAFSKKLELLFDTGRYKKLLKSIFEKKEVNDFNDFAFESDFAYDFESKGQQLDYENKEQTMGNKSIDFCYKFDVVVTIIL